MAEFPSIPLYDNFNRTTGKAIYEGVEGEERWVAKSVQLESPGHWIISSEKANSNGDGSMLGAKTFGPDLGVSLVISTLPEQYIFLPVRIQNGGTTAWKGYGIIWGPALGETLQIRRYTNGASTVIKEASSLFYAAGDTIGFTAIGSTLTAWRLHETTWSEVATVTDATYNTAGPIGIWGGDEKGRYDDMHVGTISSKHEYTASVSETLSPSQTVTRSTTIKRTPSETLTPSQAVARATAAKRSVAETLTPSQTTARVLGSKRAIAETLTPSQTVTRATAGTRTVTETLSTSDTPGFSSPTGFFRSVAEALAASDAVARSFIGARALADTLTTSDLPTTGSSPKERSVTETLSTSDSPARSTAATRTVAQTQTTSETPSRKLGSKRATADALSLSESPSRALALARAVNDSLTTSDAVTYVTAHGVSFVFESLSTSDLPVRVFHGARALADTLTTSDATKRTTGVTRKLAEALTTSDSPKRQVNAFRKPGESLTTSDAVTIAGNAFIKNVTETLSTSDSNKHTLGHFARKVTEALSTSDSVKRVYAGFRFVSDVVTGTDHPRFAIITIYHGEKRIELRFTEPRYQVTGMDRYTVSDTSASSIAEKVGEDSVRVSLEESTVTVNQPDPNLYLSEWMDPVEAETGYDDKVTVNVGTK